LEQQRIIGFHGYRWWLRWAKIQGAHEHSPNESLHGLRPFSLFEYMLHIVSS
jgi:hypothetical protein